MKFGWLDFTMGILVVFNAALGAMGELSRWMMFLGWILAGYYYLLWTIEEHKREVGGKP